MPWQRAVLGLAAVLAHSLASASSSDFSSLLSARSLSHEDEVAMSPDGGFAAIPLRLPPDPPPASEYLPNGVPSALAGNRLRIVSRGGISASDPCPSLGSCWDASWSPDGKRLAFYSDADGAPRVWVFDREAGQVRRVNDSTVRARRGAGTAPIWYPDGQALVVALRLGSSAKAKEAPTQLGTGSRPRKEDTAVLARVQVESGAVTVLVRPGAEALPGVPRLSASGMWLSYLPLPRRQAGAGGAWASDLAILSAYGGAARLAVGGLRAPDASPLDACRWHPSEDRLFFVERGALMEADLRTGKDGLPRKVAGAPAGLLDIPPIFSRDGQEILLAVAPTGPGRFGPRLPSRLLWVPLELGRARDLSLPADWAAVTIVMADERTAWQPKPGSLTVYARLKGGGHALARFEEGHGRPAELWRGRGSYAGFGNPAHAGGILASFEDPATPPGVFWFDGDFSGRQRLLAVNPALDDLVGAETRPLTCSTPAPGGGNVDTLFWLVLPTRSAHAWPPPAVAVLSPDGDGSALSERFPPGERVADIPLGALTASGYAVLLSSTKAGSPGKIGDIAAQLAPQVRAASVNGFIDFRRVALLGLASGGRAVGDVLSRTDAYKAGVAVAAARDLGSIRAPLLLVLGEGDPAFEDAERMSAAAQRRGLPAALARYPGESGGPSGWSLAHQQDALTRVLDFLKRNLGPEAL